MAKYSPDTDLRSTRKNGQVVQPNIEYTPDDNGWPEPLTDPSTPYKIGVTNGKNGETMQVDTKTSQDSWHLPEGAPGAGGTQPEGDLSGQRGSEANVSQKIWSAPEGDKPSGATQPDIDGDTSVRSSNPLQTSQQAAGEHHDPEGSN